MYKIIVFTDETHTQIYSSDIVEALATFSTYIEMFKNDPTVHVFLVEESDYGTTLINSTMIIRGKE